MRVDIGGTRIFFDVEGAKYVPSKKGLHERPTLLLLHGGPGWDHSYFKLGFGRLADLAQVIYMDHRGNGRSDWSTPEHWSLCRWADDVVEFCRTLEIVKPIVLGSSFGGTVAMSYATRHPDHARKLILCNTTAQRRPDLVLQAFERLGGSAVRDAARNYLERPNPQVEADYLRLCVPYYSKEGRRSGVPPPANYEGAIRNPAVTYYYARDRVGPSGEVIAGEAKTFNLLPDLKSIKCPTLVMAGTDDPITPIEGARDIVAMLPSGLVRLIEFPGCGHSIMRDDGERYFGAIREFILED